MRKNIKLSGDKKELYNALIYLKGSDPKAFSRAAKSLSDAPLKNPLDEEDVENLVRALDKKKTEALLSKREIKRALIEMPRSTPERRVELIRVKHQAKEKKRKAEKSIKGIVQDISLKTAEIKGKIVDWHADKISELSLKSDEANEKITSINEQISAIEQDPKGASTKRINLQQRKDSLLKILRNISKQQRKIAAGMRREALKAEFSIDDNLKNLGVDTPGVSRILVDRVFVLSELESATGRRAKELSAALKSLDEKLNLASKAYQGEFSPAELRRISMEYTELSSRAPRQIALREKLKSSAMGKKRSSEIFEIRKKITSLNEDISESLLDADTEKEILGKVRRLQERRDHLSFESKVIRLAEESLKNRDEKWMLAHGRSSKGGKADRRYPEDKDLYAIAEQIISALTHSSKAIGEIYADSLRAADVAQDLLSSGGRSQMGKEERAALKSLGKQIGKNLRLIENEEIKISKNPIIAKSKAYGAKRHDGVSAYDYIMQSYFGMTPDAMAIVTLKGADRHEEGARGATRIGRLFSKILGSKGAKVLGAAYVYGIALYLGDVPELSDEESPEGVFVYPPLTAYPSGIEEAYKGIKKYETKETGKTLGLLPPWKLMGAYRSAFEKSAMENIHMQAVGIDKMATAARIFIESGSDDIDDLRASGEGEDRPDPESLGQASLDLYFKVKRKAHDAGLIAAEEEADRLGLDWKIPAEEKSKGGFGFRPETLKGYKDFEKVTVEYKEKSNKWIALRLRKNKANATRYIYTELLGGEMLGASDEDIEEKQRAKESFRFSDIYLKPPVIRGKAWGASHKGLEMMSSFEGEKDALRVDLSFANSIIARISSNRKLGDAEYAWLLSREPWLSPNLASKIKKPESEAFDEKDIEGFSDYINALSESNPFSGSSEKFSPVSRSFVFKKLEEARRDILNSARSDYERAINPANKLALEADLKDAQAKYEEAKYLDIFSKGVSMDLYKLSLGAPYWTYVLRTKEKKRPLMMGYALDQSGAMRMAKKRDLIIGEVWSDGKYGDDVKTYSQLTDAQRRILKESGPKSSGLYATYFSPSVFGALVPTKEEISKIGEAEYKALLKRSAIFTSNGQFIKAGVPAALETITMLPKKGEILSYEPEDDDANYAIEVQTIEPGRQYKVRSIIDTVDESGKIKKLKTEWISHIGEPDIRSIKKFASKIAKRYSKQLDAKELEKNPALCKCIVTGEYMAGALSGYEQFSSDYKSNPKKAVKKHSLLKNPSEDVTDFFAGKDFTEGTQRIPAYPQEAYKVGYAEGIIEGLELCGVKNYFARKRLKRDYEKAISAARKRMRAKASGISLGRQVAEPVIETESGQFGRVDWSSE